MGCAFKNSTSIRDRTFDPLRRYVRSPPEKSPAIADRFANRSMAVLASVAGAKIAPPWLAALGVKQVGARSAGNPHAACDVEGTGNVARSSGLPARQPSTLPMSGMWKRSHGGTIEAPPDERGGNGYVLPNATAPRSLPWLRGQSRRSHGAPITSRLPLQADNFRASRHSGFVAKGDIGPAYSIVWSARISAAPRD